MEHLLHRLYDVDASDYRKPFQRSFNNNNDIKSVIIITAEDQRQTWVGSIQSTDGIEYGRVQIFPYMYSVSGQIEWCGSLWVIPDDTQC